MPHPSNQTRSAMREVCANCDHEYAVHGAEPPNTRGEHCPGFKARDAKGAKMIDDARAAREMRRLRRIK